MERWELYLPPVVFATKRKKAARPKKEWSSDRLNILKQKFATTFNKDLAVELGCGWRTVIRKAREFGLEKEEGFLDKKRPEIVKLQIGSQQPNPHKGEKGWYVPGSEIYWFKSN
jgi:hypothetical protein